MSQPAQKQDKKPVYKPRPISGYPEWLPEVRLVEQQWMDDIRNVFESYGFCNVETPSVEELDVLLAKGETDKEIYTLSRLQADPDEDKDARLGLHFDLTVPLARYVAQHFNNLVFPFKRYQIQRVWRGERPQKGRMREFYQADIDVINVDQLPLHFDAELPAIMYRILTGLNIPPIRMQINNRKILVGYLTALGVSDITTTTRVIDKLEKIGEDAVREQLQSEAGLDNTQIDKALELAKINSADASFADAVRALGVTSEMMDEGIAELSFVMEHLQHLPEGAVLADMSVVRGLDYYTGTVYETRFIDDPDYGSICSGGRYDDLAGSYINKKLPGIGISIGFTRLFDRMVDKDLLDTGRKCPSDVLVVLPHEDRRAEVLKTAEELRARGLKVEMFHAASKLKRQLSYAERKGIPYVWFPPFEDGNPHEVKNMEKGVQYNADPSTWLPERGE